MLPPQFVGDTGSGDVWIALPHIICIHSEVMLMQSITAWRHVIEVSNRQSLASSNKLLLDNVVLGYEYLKHIRVSSNHLGSSKCW